MRDVKTQRAVLGKREREKEREGGTVEVSKREEERGCKSMTEIDKVKK